MYNQHIITPKKTEITNKINELLISNGENVCERYTIKVPYISLFQIFKTHKIR